MKLVRQPPGSNLCGQACLATLLGISLDEAVTLVGVEGGTRTKHLKRALSAMGVPHASRRTLGAPERDDTALLFFWSADRSAAHWVLWHGRKYYDPISGVFRKLPRHLEGANLTSHLKVFPHAD
jgi:hypothetical protein